jgi:hypothetical protein
MALHRLETEIPAVSPPRFVQIMLDESSGLINEWQGDHSPRQFVPADYYLIYEALRALRPRFGPAPLFCEWGSGFGLATLMAASLGWQATGIEIQGKLVAESRRISRSFGIRARFLHGSFFPNDPEAVENLATILGGSDLCYVYPWPDEEIRIFDLFDRHAKPGATLLAYHGIEDVRIYQKD